jgi:hypothetical protein
MTLNFDLVKNFLGVLLYTWILKFVIPKTYLFQQLG